LNDEALPDTEGEAVPCPDCGTAIRLDASFDAAAFACPSCGCDLELEDDNTLHATRPAADAGTRAAPDAAQPTITQFLTQQGVEGEQVSLDADDVGVSNDTARRYDIGEELARGGMGAVLSAKDMNLRRDVAMKLVLNPKQVRKDQLLRFVHEAQVTGQLEHPSIVPVHELGVDADDNVYYTMKFVNGSNLGDILKGIRGGDTELIEAYPLPRLLNIFIKACEALAFAHSRGVIHRDLKPDNIMVGDFGEVLIVDWGLAKVLASSECGTRNLSSEALAQGDADSPTNDPEEQNVGASIESVRDSHAGTRTLDGAVMGTPAYMAPEQADGDLERMGPPADIYAMGAILYAILTLEAPFTGSSAREILDKVLDGDVVAPDLHEGAHPHCADGTVPASLSAVCMKAMSENPDDRYESVTALQADVQAYLDGFATHAEEAGLWRLVQLFVARHKAMVIAGLSAFVILTVVIAISFVVNLQARQVAERERSAAFIARGEAETALQAFKDEQARGIESRKTAAPAMIRAAKVLIEKDDLEAATIQTDLARDYDPALGSAHLLAAQLAIVEADYAAALSALSEYLKLKPDDELSQRLVEICHDAASRPASEAPTLAFAQTLSEQGNWQLANRLTVDADEALALYQKRIWDTWGGINHLSKNVLMRQDGKLRILSNPSNFTSIKALAGMPIAELRLRDGHGILDLAPLSGMPLETLVLHNTTANNLAPVKGMSLREFVLIGSRIDNIEPLAGMRLESVKLSWNAVGDLGPLRGAPITDLSLSGLTKLRDLSPLEGMPLKTFRMHHTGGVKSLAALATCTQLETLDLRTIPICDNTPLRGLRLKDLHYSTAKHHGGDYCREKMDLGVFADMPLTNLYFQAPARNAEALRGMQLESLTLINTGITNLSFVGEMPLRKFASMSGSAGITDLRPLQDLPLVSLKVGSYRLKDISPIAKMKDLEHLELPKQCEPLPYLDQLPNLKTIGKESVHAYKTRRAAKAAKDETP